MSQSVQNLIKTIVPLALLAIAGNAYTQATDVDCNQCVDTADIAAGAVTGGKIAIDAVNGNKIKDGSVSTDDLAHKSVTSDKIKNGAVSLNKVVSKLKADIGTYCEPGMVVVGKDASGNFVCEPSVTTDQQNADCVFANGLRWCYNNDACGEACNDVCAAKGLTSVADNTVWFEAQNTEAKCQVVANALGIGSSAVNFSNFTYACSEDTAGAHGVGSGLTGPLLCSSSAGCPNSHRTNMD